MNYKVEIDNGILKAKIAGHHAIWMHRAPRNASLESEPGLYILADERGYCCYVGETDNFKTRMVSHESKDKFSWWSHTIYFWDESPAGAFDSTDDRRWYERRLKESVEPKHPTFTKTVQNKPMPESGEEVLSEILALLDVIGFDAECQSASSLPPSPPPPSPPPSKSEPLPRKNHKPPLGPWPNYTTLARAIAEKNGKPGTAGGIHQKLTNFWAPGRGRYAKANPETRQMLESFGVQFDASGFVKSCENVPFPL